jgi:Flp pilus assembly protein TadD
LELALTAEPRNAQLLNDLGVVCSRQGDMEQAAHYYEAAVAAQPMQLTYRKNLADLYYSCLGRTDEAVSIYTQLLNEYPRDVEVLTALAIISKNNHLREQAQVFIKKVLELEPWNSEAREFLVGL